MGSSFLKRLLVPVPGIILFFILFFFHHLIGIYFYLLYMLVVPILLMASNIRSILKANWVKVPLLFMLLSLAEYIYAFSWPIAALVGGFSWDKMVTSIVIIIGSIINIVMFFVVIVIKLMKRT